MKLPLSVLPMIATVVVCAWAQQSGTTSGASTATTTGGTTTTTNGVTTTTPPVTVAPPGNGGARPVFLSGAAMMDDGSPLPGNVDIQSLCGTVRRTMGQASAATGNFAFQWASANQALGDASQPGRMQGSGGASLTGTKTGSRGMDPLANCELTADLPGYSSSKVSLYDRAGQDNFDVGTIVLHRIAAGEGHTVSVLALEAPKEARKSFDKGMRLAAANKPADAAASFAKAVAVYPEFADAWLKLGSMQWQTGVKEAARVSFLKAMDLDNKLVGPWQKLGFMACDGSQWEDAVRYLDQAVRLDPLGSPGAWYFNALANYKLGRLDRAERSLRAEMKLDGGSDPHEDYLLGLILIGRQDLQGGAQALRNYIATAPKSEDVSVARRELSKVENQMGR